MIPRLDFRDPIVQLTQNRRVTQQTFHIVVEEVTLISSAPGQCQVTRKLRVGEGGDPVPDGRSAGT
jgi:hypothetical protein